MFLLALPIGIASGLRVFTPVAVLFWVFEGGPLATLFAVLAVGEYVVDALPQVPARTTLPSPLLRAGSGAYCGCYLAMHAGSSAVVGIVLGLIGAAIGLYGGLALRLRAISTIGAIPAAVAEDAIAIAVSIAAVLPIASVR